MREKTTTPFATSSSLAHRSLFVFNKHAVCFLPITLLSVSGPRAIFAQCDPINKCFDADLFGTPSVLGSSLAGIVFPQVSAHYHLSMILVSLSKYLHQMSVGIVQLATQCICMPFEAVRITCTFGCSGEYGGFESSFGTF